MHTSIAYALIRVPTLGRYGLDSRVPLTDDDLPYINLARSWATGNLRRIKTPTTLAEARWLTSMFRDRQDGIDLTPGQMIVAMLNEGFTYRTTRTGPLRARMYFGVSKKSLVPCKLATITAIDQEFN